MIYIVITQIALFLIYPIAIASTIGVQPSISDSWYSMRPAFRPLFTFWLWAVAASMVGVFMCTLDPLYLGSAACLAFCGTAAAFKEQMTGAVHAVGAIGGFAMPLAALTINGIHFPFWASVVVIAVILKLKISNRIWWMEICGGLLILSGILKLTF